ncbi:response regulator [Actinoplanes sp. NPDC051475]|uniref:response regulator n=1 Tax=Actinoplanes sp. NPDC051475 TaxID=3157225 RepID=UPI00344D0145
MPTRTFATRRQPPDVDLTDLNMPHLDGLQLCQAIRQDPALRDIPVAILSGGIQPGDSRFAQGQVCGVQHLVETATTSTTTTLPPARTRPLERLQAGIGRPLPLPDTASRTVHGHSSDGFACEGLEAVSCTPASAEPRLPVRNMTSPHQSRQPVPERRSSSAAAR